MNRALLSLAVLALVLLAAPAGAAGITGQYMEARTCDVWTGACFANAEMNLTGKHAVMAWKIDKGSFQDVELDGLSVVAVVAASDTLGLQQTGQARSSLIVDERASVEQREALIHFAQQQGGDLVKNVIDVKSAPIDLNLCSCKTEVCAKLKAGDLARIETRCIDHRNDKACGHEKDFYPPLSKDVKVKAAIAVEHSYRGLSFNETWKDSDRRGAYVGSFEIR